MGQIVGNMGWLIRISISLAFAGFWGYLAWYWHDMGEFGPGLPTVIGVGVLAGIAGLSAIIGLVRMVTSTANISLPERTGPSTDLTGSSDFDPDEVMARYMAQREEAATEEPTSTSLQPSEPAQPSQRPQFGRKQI
jgi:hypothetical protein